MTSNPFFQYSIINCKVQDLINISTLLCQHLIELHRMFKK